MHGLWRTVLWMCACRHLAPLFMDRRNFSTALVFTPWIGLGSGMAGRASAQTSTASTATALIAPPISVQKLNLERMVCFETWHATSLYERFQRLLVLEGGQASIRFLRRNLTQDRTLADHRPARRYTLLVDGTPRASVDLAEGAPHGDFTLALSGLAGGWHELDIAGLADGETCPRWFAYVLRDGVQPASMPVCTGSYDISKARAASEHAWAWVPARYRPDASPLPPSRPVPFSDAATDMVALPVVAVATGTIRYPNVDKRGVVSSFCLQSYYYTDLITRYPRLALLDGPRGVGSLSMPTHIEIGTATRDADPNSAPLLNVYVTDPWRLMRVADDGTVTTLAGWRHRGMASHYRDTERSTSRGEPGRTLELVGDWSSVPTARRGFHELWGMAWDAQSLKPDPAAAPIAAEDNRRPHIGNPVCFVTDSQNNRVCRIEFDGRSHATPARVSEFLTGLEDPWDIVYWRESLIVSERGAHRIAQYDIRTRRLMRVIVSGAKLATISATERRASSTATLAELRAQACVAPEGLYLVDDWLYFGSFAQRQVRRVNLSSGKLEVVLAEAPVSGNSRFVKICVSDGTFGPKGAVFVQSWDNGAPKTAYLPDGSTWRLRMLGFDLEGYGSAVAARNGRLYFGSSRYGLWRVTKGAPMNDRLFREGQTAYVAAHYPILHGTGGFGHFGLPLPWGKSEGIDYYLTQHGHRRGGQGGTGNGPGTPGTPVPGLTLPTQPTSVGHNTLWYLGSFSLTAGGYYDDDGFAYRASYSTRKNLSAGARLGVTLHSSGGYNSFVNTSYGPFQGVDVEVRTQDGEAKQSNDPTEQAEWWCYSADGQPYPVRRVAALLDAVAARHPEIDVTGKGIVYNGNSMGNGGVLHTMILPDPWRARIAYARGSVGVFMPRQIAQRAPRQYKGWPADSGDTAALWDAVDFALQAKRDAIVRGMHYRQQFSSNDMFSEGLGGNTQLEWVNLCEDNRISAVATWVHNGHSATEKGVNFPDVRVFEVPEQDITLDRAHPCFTRSTGNWPQLASDRRNRDLYPRGHYNLGLTWDHARTVDSANEIVFHLQYRHRTGFGTGIPDQPDRITVDVTPRRARHFALRHGEQVRWAWDGTALTGTARVQGDVLTAEGIPLVSGAGYKRLRFFRA